MSSLDNCFLFPPPTTKGILHMLADSSSLNGRIGCTERLSVPIAMEVRSGGDGDCLRSLLPPSPPRIFLPRGCGRSAGKCPITPGRVKRFFRIKPGARSPAWDDHSRFQGSDRPRIVVIAAERLAAISASIKNRRNTRLPGLDKTSATYRRRSNRRR